MLLWITPFCMSEKGWWCKHSISKWLYKFTNTKNNGSESQWNYFETYWLQFCLLMLILMLMLMSDWTELKARREVLNKPRIQDNAIAYICTAARDFLLQFGRRVCGIKWTSQCPPVEWRILSFHGGKRWTHRMDVSWRRIAVFMRLMRCMKEHETCRCSLCTQWQVHWTLCAPKKQRAEERDWLSLSSIAEYMNVGQHVAWGIVWTTYYHFTV
jgi:hypothetical protein